MNSSITISEVEQTKIQLLQQAIEWSDKTILVEKTIEECETISFPNRKEEEWKYTSFDKILKRGLSNPQRMKVEIDQSDVDSCLIPNLDCYLMVTCNGQLQSQYSDYPKEILVNTIQSGENRDSTSTENLFLKLNRAFCAPGIHVQIPKGMVVKKPIVFIEIAKFENDSYVPVKHVFECANGAEVSIINIKKSIGEGSCFYQANVEFRLEKRSHLAHFQIQNDSPKASTYSNCQVYQQANSVYKQYTVSLSGEVVRNDVHIALQEENCEAHLSGLYVLDGKEHVDNHTVVDHQAANCASNEYYKGIMDDQSTGVFNGKVFVKPHAQKTNAYQQNRNLLLSDDAAIFTKPQLEILADDVKCSHGATIGQLDADQLFYLQARGLNPPAAEAMLTYAFASEILLGIKITELRDYLLKQLATKLNFDLE